ncbi:phosphate ABC transporter ATP-binding protein [Solibacillus sp. R5-41]|uniref:ABC transporter ATP-binding protein n=1 Tax=Solibacillus sp. R5-41 TaxID=2048654 RepID=UPI000C127C59|nr:phosphate ABC transporter ATP-binding protein [Solibacillus sp. R5-41]ATP42003.1 phosphate ABC transporter ATP-binding protein [Solibacillus sp. R5-41]
MLQHAITFDDVSFEINQTKLLKNITGAFYKGQITTLIGPSGAGKTTLLKLCNGLTSASNGQIRIEQEPIELIEPTALRRKIGIALQSAPIFKTSVYENLTLPRKLQQQQLYKEEALSFLQAVGLDEAFLMREATDLSGGQKQKLSIARTLVNQSEVLLLDEITSALDPKSVREIEELVVQLNEKDGVTIIWITHNIEQAMQLGHFTWMLKEGQLIEADKTEALFQSQNPVVQSFIQQGDE